MKSINGCIAEIKKQTEAGKKILLMLDFDGTISPIMPRPEQAYLPEKTRSILKKINQFYPVAIISGRPIDVVREKVGVKEFAYAGSHGLEWLIDGKLNLKRIPKSVLKEFSKIKKDFKKISDKYPRLLIEKKPYSFTFHYKFINRRQMPAFRRDLDKFINPICKNSLLKVFWDKKTLDITPRLDWNKGHIALLMLKYFQGKTKKILLPVYIGDSETDEDAFSALKNGITIRVGKNEKSLAKYFIKTNEINRFLCWLTENN